ncbi:MAG: hypothetical protein ACK5PP_08045 [Acidimicrobiales bacterium]
MTAAAPATDRPGAEAPRPGPTHRRRSLDRSGASTAGLVVMAAAVAAPAYLLLTIHLITTTGYDTWGGVLIAPALLTVGLLALRRLLARHEPDRWIRAAISLGLVTKLTASFARFYANEYLLGPGDAFGYHLHGAAVAAELRRFVIGGPAYRLALPDLFGTEFIRLLTAGLYTVMGPSRTGGFVVFAFLSFWGLYLFYRAFSIALPGGDRRRYVVLVFFLPSMLFWPSSLGKEAWMITMIGLASYGLARILTGRPLGYAAVTAGVAGMVMVRPHVAGIFAVAAAVALGLRRSTGRRGLARRIVGLVFVVVMAGLVMRQLQLFFGLDSGLDAGDVLALTTSRSTQGGSRFDAADAVSIATLPWAAVTVLFRPFLFEAGSVTMLISAIEGSLLLIVFGLGAARLVRLPSMVFRHPYVGYAAAYTLVFVVAFSAIGNFGILVRQRTQLYPLALVAVTAPLDGLRRSRNRNERMADRARSEQLDGAEIERQMTPVGDGGGRQRTPGEPGSGAR